jgi:plastocyanin
MRAPKPALLALLLAASASFTALAANKVVVSQKARAFSTAHVQISRGDTLSFSNDDKFIHQVYVESPAFTYESDEQPPGTNVDVTFPKPGLFEVRCHIHPKMLLQVDVR